MITDLSNSIIRMIQDHRLKPAQSELAIEDQKYKDSYFSVFFGCRADFKELYLHLSDEPTHFVALGSVSSLKIPLSFDLNISKEEKIDVIKKCLIDVAINLKLPIRSNCIPFFLFIESQLDEDVFYKSEKYPCGFAGTTENHFKLIRVGNHMKSLRKEMIVIGDQNAMALSIDDSDDSLIESLGLNNQSQKAYFGALTFLKPLNELKVTEENNILTISDGKNSHVWKLTK